MAFNEKDLRSLAEKELSSTNESCQNNIRKKNEEVLKNTIVIFLCHRKLDEELVLGVRLKLEREYGYKVYIDWLDDAEFDRKDVSKKTAETLRIRLRQSRCLMFVHTENSIASKWMPWELGFMDGHKPNKSTILPIRNLLNSTPDYGDQEY
jgi:TIR domain